MSVIKQEMKWKYSHEDIYTLQTCRKLLYEEHVTDSFSAMVKTHSAVLQKVVVKIIYYLVSNPELR